jgi:O-antigen/teichoic acid export membrane protein
MRDHFIQWVRRWQRHEAWRFAWDSGVLFAGNGAMAFLFLLFHVLLGRWMLPVDYATLVALIGLLNVLNVPAGVMQLTMARYVAEYVHRDDADTWLLLVRRGLRLVTQWGLVALGLWCLGAPWLRATLKAPTTASLAMVGVIAFVFLYTPILGGALQGSRRFGWSAVAGIGVAASRLALALLVVLLQGGLTPILGMVAVSVVVGLLISYWPLREHRQAPLPGTLPAARSIHGYFWAVLFGQIALFLLINADLILSPRYLSGDTLAAYGKAATLSRIVFFLPLPIVTAMFPRAVTSGSPRLILVPAFVTLLLCATAAAVITLVPALPMRLMYGISDPLHLELTRWYVWAAIPLALINILSPYLWARREAARTLWLIPVTLGYLTLLSVFHATPQQIILCLLAGGLAALALLLGLTVGVLRRPET